MDYELEVFEVYEEDGGGEHSSAKKHLKHNRKKCKQKTAAAVVHVVVDDDGSDEVVTRSKGSIVAVGGDIGVVDNNDDEETQTLQTRPSGSNNKSFREFVFGAWWDRLQVWRRTSRRYQTTAAAAVPVEKVETPLYSSAKDIRRNFIPYDNQRRIKANDRAYNSQYKYANNYIKTSKYSVVTFLPLNLFEQFQRLANFYFLCLLVLQLIPAISSLTPITTALPLIGVLGLTAIKDAYDDFQRHMSDSQVNNRKSQAVRQGAVVQERWSAVQVGDVIRMDNNQFVAADILLLTTSEPNGLCYIETAELDGETNLKCRQCLTETAEMGQDDAAICEFDGEIVCETPNNLLNKFEGTLTWRSKQYSLDNDKVILRGCVLRNTQWCYGVVIFAGKDTKLMQNSGKTKFKRTSIDRLLNFLIIGIVFFLLSVCLFCMVGCGIWESLIGRHFQTFLPWDTLVPSEPLGGATIIALLVFFSYAIVMNTVVPISLYVSVEVIRFVQSFLINWDEQMYDARSGTHAKARTTTLNEELGQIEYIFSDKTGTLTQNIMTFNKCSIAGNSYGDIIDKLTGEPIDLTAHNHNAAHTNNNPLTSAHSSNTHTSTTTLPPPLDFSFNPNYEPEFRFYDRSLLEAVRGGDEASHQFFRLLALCHTVMSEQRVVTPPPKPEDSQEGLNGSTVEEGMTELQQSGGGGEPAVVERRLEYQAQSPDEAALVSAARNFGFVFMERTPNSITIEVMGRREVYELLCILDFNNVRKRMSVILRREGQLRLYCKGADNVIYERLRNDCNDLKNTTQEHLNKFAGEGLRTLCLASREIDEGFFNDWKMRHQEAALSLHDRDERLDAIYEEIERDMQLLGVTAIEDKLQDGVPQAISNLMLANIKIWVLTGDKQETAINIGYSCQLLNDELADVFIVDATTYDEVHHQLVKFRDNIRILHKFQPTTNGRLLLDSADVMAAEGGGGSGFTTSPASSAQHTPSTGTLGGGGKQHRATAPAISVVTFSKELDYMEGIRGSDNNGDSQQAAGAAENGTAGGGGSLDDSGAGFAIVVNGHSLVHCLHPQLEKLFLDIVTQCRAVICCRVTPLQKALVVELVKKYKHAVTLAIGDGANDVSMIKAAHIGVGISGQEGLQAVLASDYSISQFRFLERLLLVHGRWSYYRMCSFLRYFFNKNFAFTLCHLWFAFFCGFSAQTVFDPMYISVYNLFYTALPVLAVGVFDQDVSDKNSISYPQLYRPGHINLFFNKKEFFRSAVQGCYVSIVLFFIPYGTYHDAVSPNGQSLSDYMTLCSVVATILVIVNTAQIAMDTQYWTIFNHITIWGSLLFYFIMDYFYNYVIGGIYVGSLTAAMAELTFWCTAVLTVTIAVMPVLAARFYLTDVKPTLSDRVRLKQRLAQMRSRQSEDVLRGGMVGSSRRARRSIRSGYAFAHQEGFGRLITSGKIIRKVANSGGGGGNTAGTGGDVTTTGGKGKGINNGGGAATIKNSSVAPLSQQHVVVAGGVNSRGMTTTQGGDSGELRAPIQDLDTINL